MCGICGVYDMKSEGRIPSIHTVNKMQEVLQHRGPNDRSYYRSEQVAFGFTRLSIMDLEHGSQPFFNEDRTIVAVCNGEIFNYKELKKQLLQSGHQIHTGCDMELIPHLYEQFGMEFVHKVNGQFAIALYDTKLKVLYLIRDHMGVCPLFYTISDGVLVFASEIKAILQHPMVEKRVDITALDQLLTFPGVVAPRTFFQGISSLENGHYLAVKNDTVTTIEYWDLRYPKANEISYVHDEAYYLEKLREILRDAVAKRIVADVPVGLYLSGGLDSSLIAALACQQGTETRKSFSLTFENKQYSEEKYQRMMASHIKSNHFEREFKTTDIIENLRKVVWHSEAALKETYNTASYMLSRMANEQGIKAVLTGEGADELFAGYVGYRFDQLRAKDTSHMIDAAEAKLADDLWGDSSFFYERNYLPFENVKNKLYSGLIAGEYGNVSCLNSPIIRKERISGIDILHKRSYIDYKLRLPEHLLAGHGDRMTYANSVEGRYPFLDRELLEYVTNELPPWLKLHNFKEKYILKKAASTVVPSEIIKRPKYAFVAPGSREIIMHGDEYIKELLSYERIKKQGYFNPDYVQNLINTYSAPGFKLNVPYEPDLLIVIITFCIFLDVFDMPSL